MQLPHTGSMPSARAQRVSAAVEARIVPVDVSKLLLTHDADAALCELQPPSADADGGGGGAPAQYCWACLTTPLLEQGAPPRLAAATAALNRWVPLDRRILELLGV